jgi:hypothetical protein
MISDVLAEAHKDIQSYLDDPIYASIYSVELRAEIRRVIAAMVSLREKLDRPPLTEREGALDAMRKDGRDLNR